MAQELTLQERQKVGYKVMKKAGFKPRWWKRVICWYLDHKTMLKWEAKATKITYNCVRCSKSWSRDL